MENNQQSGFNYTYSAKDQAEIKRIREHYAPSENASEDKMSRLRRLDASVYKKAQAVSLIFGVIGVLVLGFGMSLAMSELAAILGAYESMALLIGSLIGVLGGVLISLAHPVYNAILKRERARIAPEIIRLTDELLK